ncbi:hypothetical protein [Halalkalibacterium halodurans]|uniref:hypothetical protein n=1 Tax=Halalkalibacterium halodurans TaxID=86665 RepID=UPI002AA99944|nr:hypothetical protein [Halalkalibacterium halodurans]MDY7223986.1 hypothetical protein [Halalkalibacterium halodurans]MDY7243207.1 hypothetical protein [Halalkalibacterium halodurans]
MKKLKLLGITVLLTGLLAACGEAATTEEEPAEGQTEETTDESIDEASDETAEEEATDDEEEEGFGSSVDKETGEGYNEAFGHIRTIGIGYNDEAGLDGTDDSVKPIEMGPMQLSINGVAVLEIEPNEDAKILYFGDQDKVRVVVAEMKVQNTSEEDVTFYPNDAILVTSTGEQVEPDFMMTADFGGEFYGEVIKEGQAWWILNNLDDDIENLTMIISAPYDSNSLDDLSDEKRLKFEILDWESAKERNDSN